MIKCTRGEAIEWGKGREHIYRDRGVKSQNIINKEKALDKKVRLDTHDLNEQ